MSKKVLITGASAGFGKLTTATLLEKGHNVVASMRGADGKNKVLADFAKTLIDAEEIGQDLIERCCKHSQYRV